MSRDYRVCLEDMLSAIAKIRRYVKTDAEILLSDEQVFDAVTRNLEIIGEAAKSVPEEIRSRYPLVEWRKLSGLRDVIAHEYFGLSENIILDVVQSELPNLETETRKILADLNRDI